jgi:hypothetical protein
MPDPISIGYPALDKVRLAELALEERLRDKVREDDYQSRTRDPYASGY